MHNPDSSLGAIEKVCEASGLARTTVESCCTLGTALFEADPLGIGPDNLLQPTAENPLPAGTVHDIGRSMLDLEAFDKAAACFRLALALKPDYAEASFNLGHALKRLGRLDEALVSYNRAFQMLQYAAARLGGTPPQTGDETLMRIAFGSALFDAGRLFESERQFARVLEIDPDIAEAHQALSSIYYRLGDAEKSARHRDLGFQDAPITTTPCSGNGEPVPLLVLCSARVGNIPWSDFVDRGVFETTTVTAEYFDPAHPLPPHRLILNAIGDADICGTALDIAARLAESAGTPVINAPRLVMQSGRFQNAERLGKIPNVITPRMAAFTKHDLNTGRALTKISEAGIAFPCLVRPPGFHSGDYFMRIEDAAALHLRTLLLPGEDFIAIEFMDSRANDGLFRKFRVMRIDGTLYPIHLAVSSQWKVHYFSSEMDRNAAHREEEENFLRDFNGYLGNAAVEALERIAETLGLDYCGMDFGIDTAGRLQLFEANATMRIYPPGSEKQWDYRRAPLAHALRAAQNMLTEFARR